MSAERPATSLPPPPAPLAIAAALGAVWLLWGSTYLAIRFAIETLPPLLMAAARFLTAGGLLYAWARLRGAPRPGGANWRAAAVVGSLLLLGGNGSVVVAERHVPSGIAALLVATVPLWMVLLDWLRPGGLRPHWGAGLGVAVGFAGVAVLIGPAQVPGGEAVHRGGAALLVLAALSWSAGSLYSRSAALPRAPLLNTAMQMVCGGAALAVAGVLLGEPGTFDPARVSLRSVGALAYLIVLGSLVAFSCYAWLIRVTSPALVSTYAYVNPLVAVFLGWALAGEALGPRVGTATAVIVVSVALITLARRTARGAAPGPRPGKAPPAAAPGCTACPADGTATE